MIPGKKFNLGGKIYEIPPITYPQVCRLRETIDKIIEAGREPCASPPFGAYLTIIHAALLRNYPEITREELGNLIDLGNLLPLLSAALGPHAKGPPANFKGRYPGLHLVRSKPTFRKGKD